MARANLKKNIKGPMKMKNSYMEPSKEVKFEGSSKASMKASKSKNKPSTLKASASNSRRRPSKLEAGGMAKKCKSGNCAKYQNLGQSM